MNITTRSIAMTVGLTAILGSGTLFADPGDSVAKIPFAFQAAGKTLDGGTYLVRRDERSSIATVRNEANGHAIFLLTSPLHCNVGQPKMVFNREGEGYELSELRLSKAGCSYAALGSKSKRANRERGLAATVVMLPK